MNVDFSFIELELFQTIAKRPMRDMVILTKARYLEIARQHVLFNNDESLVEVLTSKDEELLKDFLPSDKDDQITAKNKKFAYEDGVATANELRRIRNKHSLGIDPPSILKFREIAEVELSERLDRLGDTQSLKFAQTYIMARRNQADLAIGAAKAMPATDLETLAYGDLMKAELGEDSGEEDSPKADG